MVGKNEGIYGFLSLSWVLITMVWLPVNSPFPRTGKR